MKRKVVLLILLLLALSLVQSVQALSSPNYILDWFTPLTTNSGGSASSAHYTVDITVGQTVRGVSTSAGYRAGLGYWYGILPNFQTRLPVIIK